MRHNLTQVGVAAEKVPILSRTETATAAPASSEAAGIAPHPRSIEVAGERLELHPEGAIHWPRRSTLLVADPHFGKDEHFRRAGVALPDGTLADDLARLDRLLAHTGAQRLVMLGDVVHAAPHPGATWPERVSAWRATHPSLEWRAVAGNHDRGFRAPSDWHLTWHDEALEAPPFTLAHDPEPAHEGYVLAGHWHPVARLRVGGESARLPVFAFAERFAVLPAFGGFTGGAPIDDPSLQCYALVDSRVIALPRREVLG